MKSLLIFITLTISLSCYGQLDPDSTIRVEEYNSLIKEVDNNKSQLSEILNKQDFIIENYEIQNNTILYVSTILGVLLAIVIVYFGWKAQKLDNEHERIKNEGQRINTQFDILFNELRDKKQELEKTVKEINDSKTEILKQKSNIESFVEKFVLDYTKDYLEKNKDVLFQNDEEKVTENEDVVTNELIKLNEQIKLIETIQNESNPDIAYKKIDVFFNAKRYEEVVNLVEELKIQDDFKKSYLFKQAYALVELGLFDEAYESYQKYLEYSSNNKAALNNLGLLQKKRGQLEEAKSYLRQALLQESNFMYFLNLLNCYDEVLDQLGVYKEYYEVFDGVEQKEVRLQFQASYLQFIEKHYFAEEIFKYHKTEYERTNNESTYLNYFEASILNREEDIINELISRMDSYHFSAAHKLILHFLLALEKCINNEDVTSELSKVNIICSGAESLELGWRYNLIDKIIEGLTENDNKAKVVDTFEKIKEHTKKAK